MPPPDTINPRLHDSWKEALAEEFQHRTGLVFVLWGRFAREKGRIIDRQRHHVLEAAHPSPLSAHNGFFGCGHFSTINRLLAEGGQDPIQWALESVR